MEETIFLGRQNTETRFVLASPLPCHFYDSCLIFMFNHRCVFLFNFLEIKFFDKLIKADFMLFEMKWSNFLSFTIMTCFKMEKVIELICKF